VKIFQGFFHFDSFFGVGDGDGAGSGVDWTAREDLGKVSLVGAGMRSHPGIAAKAFATLDSLGIVPEVVTTSPIKIACYVGVDDVERAVGALHDAFELEQPEAERAHA